MPALIDPASRAGALVAATNEVLLTEGIPGLSLRTIAARSRVSTGSIIHHLGGKARLLTLGAAMTARELHAQIDRRRDGEGALAFLPRADEEVLTTRVWLAWLELGRSDPAIEPAVARAREEERGMLAQTIDYALPRDDLDLLHALVEGLRGGVCAATHPMPPRRARALLSRHLHRWGVSVTPA